FFAVQLLDPGERCRPRRRLDVKRRRLVRVLAVPQVGTLSEAKAEFRRESDDPCLSRFLGRRRTGCKLSHVACDRGIVAGGQRKRVRREPATERFAYSARL